MTLLPAIETSECSSYLRMSGVLLFKSLIGWGHFGLQQRKCQHLRSQCFCRLLLFSGAYRNTSGKYTVTSQNQHHRESRMVFSMPTGSSVIIIITTISPLSISGLHISSILLLILWRLPCNPWTHFSP